MYIVEFFMLRIKMYRFGIFFICVLILFVYLFLGILSYLGFEFFFKVNIIIIKIDYIL